MYYDLLQINYNYFPLNNMNKHYTHNLPINVKYILCSTNSIYYTKLMIIFNYQIMSRKNDMYKLFLINIKYRKNKLCNCIVVKLH